MRRILGGCAGTTLVELLVAMALMAMLAVSGIALLRPSLAAFGRVRQHTDGELAAQAVLDQLRGELVEAQGFLRLAQAGEDPELVFTDPGKRQEGNALYFGTDAGVMVLLDAGAVPETELQAPESAQSMAGPLEAGSLHCRRFVRDEDGGWQMGESSHRLAWSCTRLLPDTVYEGGTLALCFSVAACREEEDADGIRFSRIQALEVEVRISRGEETVAVRSAVVPLPKEPCLIQ